MSIPDLSPVFEAYEALVADADAVFTHVGGLYPDCVTCQPGCSDCCHATFDLSLVEAMYLNRAFLETYEYGPMRSRLLTEAADADRTLTRMKREYFRTLRDAERNEDGAEQAMNRVFQEAAKARVKCPLLNTENGCSLYAYRPITCRLYGIPVEIGGKSHVCSKAQFKHGRGYPSVHMDKIQGRLEALSRQIQDLVESRFSELHKVYVPVSMALLTNYDTAYLGIGPAPKES